MSRHSDEHRPLLSRDASSRPLLHHDDEEERASSEVTVIRFEDDDPDYARNWPRRRKLANVAVIASMSLLSPLASAAFTPAISVIADDLGTDTAAVIAATTGFVITLGIGPLILAPLSETFGRRWVYLVCFAIFTLLQIPTALAPNVAVLIVMRTLAGFFGSVGIANGGGTISDMFYPNERAGVFGIYLLGPVMGPTLGPVIGGATVQFQSWRYIFWVMAILSAVITLTAFFFLKESYGPTILARRKKLLETEHAGAERFVCEGEDTRPLLRRIGGNLWRPVRILATQPIVTVMATYQAVIWSCQFSLLTQFEQIWSNEPYNFQPYQVGLTYLPMGTGFLIAALFIVPKVDTVYSILTEKNEGMSKPEFRLPLANIGAVLIPICLFIFAWTVEYRLHWAIVFVLLPFGIGQTTIFNCTQNYYIDAFEKYAASAIAAGSLFRSLIGGIVPVLMPLIVRSAGYGWAISIFAFASVLLAPAPALFYYYGPEIRQRFKIEL